MKKILATLLLLLIETSVISNVVYAQETSEYIEDTANPVYISKEEIATELTEDLKKQLYSIIDEWGKTDWIEYESSELLVYDLNLSASVDLKSAIKDYLSKDEKYSGVELGQGDEGTVFAGDLDGSNKIWSQVTMYNTNYVKDTSPCIKYTPDLWKATLDYLNEVYIEKYPELGLRIEYGAPTDRKIIKATGDNITKNVKTDNEKVYEISKWVKNNIEYKSYREGGIPYYPIDVLYERQGNCLGYALLIRDLLRSQGIPAVAISGTEGDMENVLNMDNMDGVDGHGWVMAYYDDCWHLCDALYDNNDVTDWSYIAKWYFPGSVEGVDAYCEAYGLKKLGNNVYKDGLFWSVDTGKIISVDGGEVWNRTIPFYFKSRYISENGSQDGYHYLDDPNDERRNLMKNAQIYNDGWIYYSNISDKKYVKENGIILSNGFISLDDKNYYLDYNGNACPVEGNIDDYRLKDGFITIYLEGNETYDAPLPGFLKKYATGSEENVPDGEEKRILKYVNNTPDIATIDQNGIITPIKEGLAVFMAIETNESGTASYNCTEIIVSVLEKPREIHFDWGNEEEKDSDIEKAEEEKTEEKVTEDGHKTDYIEGSSGWTTAADGNEYWYEDGLRQGYDKDDDSYRGKEIYDPESDAWYWLDNVQNGAIAKSKDVYQESDAGIWASSEDGTGKWVRYDANGLMIKGWCSGSGEDAKVIEAPDADKDKPVYYFDMTFGTMAKGYATIDGKEYYFDELTGVLDRSYEPANVKEKGWVNVDGIDVWYENFNRQGYKSGNAEYRGKEIYDPESDAWYWLDNVQGGAKAVSKDVYQESEAGEWGDIDKNGVKYGKWVRYDADGHMIKGWCSGSGAEAKVISSPDEDMTNPVYYFDPTFGTMAKGTAVIDGVTYTFDTQYGVLIR